MVKETCPLLFDGSFMYEEDIPSVCRNCLGIRLDSDLGSDGYPSVNNEKTQLEVEKCIGKMVCEHGSYYWITGVVRGDTTERLIEISATCDECDNFVLNSYITVCDNES